MNYQILDENILVIDGKNIKFKYEIKEIKRQGNICYILLKIPKGVELEYNELNNIYCYDEKGNQLWQISPQKLIGWENMQSIPYIGIDSGEGKSMFATDFLGRRFEVDSESGIIIDMETVK